MKTIHHAIILHFMICCLIYAQSDYSYTYFDTNDSSGQLSAFPSKPNIVRLTSKDGVSLNAIIHNVDLANKTADIYVNQRYSISFDLLDEPSIITLTDYAKKAILNENLVISFAEIDGESVPYNTKGHFPLQPQPPFSELSREGLKMLNKEAVFQLELNSDATVENVDILIGARIRRSVKKDTIKIHSRSYVSGTVYIIKEFRAVSIPPRKPMQFLTNKFIMGAGELTYDISEGDYVRKVSFSIEDRIDAAYIAVIYKGEIVFLGFRNSGTIRQIQNHIQEFLEQSE